MSSIAEIHSDIAKDRIPLELGPTSSTEASVQIDGKEIGYTAVADRKSVV